MQITRNVRWVLMQENQCQCHCYCCCIQKVFIYHCLTLSLSMAWNAFPATSDTFLSETSSDSLPLLLRSMYMYLLNKSQRKKERLIASLRLGIVSFSPHAGSWYRFQEPQRGHFNIVSANNWLLLPLTHFSLRYGLYGLHGLCLNWSHIYIPSLKRWDQPSEFSRIEAELRSRVT